MSLPKPLPYPSRHPNELDTRRISKLLEQRARYRYVTPSVQTIRNGYRIVSPCCSGNPGPTGSPVDIARIECRAGVWTLFRRDHARDMWLVHMRAERLDKLMDCLNSDPNRVFWQ